MIAAIVGAVALPFIGAPSATAAESPERLVLLATKVSAADQQSILSKHNKYRGEVGVPSLSWDNGLASDAQRWAEELANRNSQVASDKDVVLSHENPQGENLAWARGSGVSPAGAPDIWYQEKAAFVAATNKMVSKDGPWLHYSQMVWSTTTKIGCGSATTPSGRVFTSCRYGPPGNTTGQLPYPGADEGTSPGGGGSQPGSGSRPGTSDLAAMINQERTKAGCAPLKVVAKLTTSAQDQSKDQATGDKFGSVGADGSTINSRLGGLGYSRWAETVAQAQSAEDAFRFLAGSSFGKANVSNCAFKETGLGVARSASGKLYWTQDFGG
jgi:uncharacterized protein YkwD